MAAGPLQFSGGGRNPARHGAAALLILWCVALPGAAHASPAAASSPSVLLITIDTLRADHLGCYGDAHVDTPSIDALAAQGVRFDHAYAQAPITLPSHAAILTGTYPMYNGVRDFTSAGLPSSIPTLAEMLARQGYRTAAFVSSYALNSMWGLNRGFQVYDDDLGLALGHSNDNFLVERRGDRTVDRALAWLDRQGGAPFFLWVHLYDPHSPYRPPDPYLSRYASHPYDGEIAFDDAQVGRVFTRLKEMRRFDATAILLLSDHGESLGEHGEDEHGFFIYNATLHVPLIVKPPTSGPRLGKSVSQLVGAVDVAPTIAELCGIPAGETRSFQGRSLLPLVGHRTETGDAAVYAESYYPRDSFGWHELRGLLTAHFAYIDAPRAELYDLQRDPGERQNLAAVNASVAASLREKLDALERRYAGRPSATAALDPATVDRLRSLGYVTLQSSSAMQNDLRRADPKDKLEVFHRILRASDLLRAGNYPEADELLASLEASEPALYVVPFERGENFAAWGKPQQALPEFGKALSLNPAFDQALLGLGRAHFMLGQDPAAAQALELALRMNPRNFLARLALGKVYWRQNRPADAEPELAQVVKEHPELAEGHADYAIILAKQGKYRDALPQFQRALALEYRDAILYNYLGITCGELGEAEQARDAYRQAVAMNPGYAAAYLNLALLSQRRNQPEEARRYFQKTCQLSAALCREYAARFSGK